MNDSNDNEKLINEVANLLNETAEAHHKAFAATKGEDPDWPLCYADYLLEKMRKRKEPSSQRVNLSTC